MKQRVNDKGIAVPKKCQKCGSPVVMKLRGEPVYMCDNCGEYYGTVPCNVTESFMDEYGEKITLKTAKQIASRIHSKYKEDSKPPTGNQNCQLCTWCAEAQFRGLDVLPRPIYSPRDPALEIKGETIVKSPAKIKIRNKDHIVSTVKGNPGSRYYIHVKWNGGSGGHEFLIINIDAKVYAMDAQQGLVESIDKTTYFDDVDYSGSYFARLDDKQLNRELLNKMNSMKELVPWDWDKDVEYMKKHGMLGEDEDIRFIRYYVPSDKATEYLKKDPELKQYWETLNKETNGEILVDPNTKEQIGYGFVYKSGKNKGFIFNIEVMKKFRRQGFGTIILNDCVTKFGGVDLTVACDNEGAIKLYLKYGFEIVETVEGQNGRDEYYMKLKKSKTVQESSVDDQEGAGMNNETFDMLCEYVDELLIESEDTYDEYYGIIYESAILIGDKTIPTNIDLEAVFEAAYGPMSDDIVQEALGPYEEYLRRHNYDPKTNTLDDPRRPGKRMSAGKTSSKKARNRLNAFLKRHHYDPKTGTILTDITDGAGNRKRVPFEIVQNPSSTSYVRHDITQSDVRPVVPDSEDKTGSTIVKRGGIQMATKFAESKPKHSEPVFAHESIHAKENLAKKDAVERSTALLGSRGKRHELRPAEFDTGNDIGTVDLHGRVLDNYLFDIVGVMKKYKPDDPDMAELYETESEDVVLDEMRGIARKIMIGEISPEEWSTNPNFLKEIQSALPASNKRLEKQFAKARKLQYDPYDWENPDPRYEAAEKLANKRKSRLNSHDSEEEEIIADDEGSELASRYTRGVNTGPAAFRRVHDTVSDSDRSFRRLSKSLMDPEKRKKLEKFLDDEGFAMGEDLPTRIWKYFNQYNDESTPDARAENLEENIRARQEKKMVAQAARRKLAKEMLQSQIDSGKLTPEQIQKARRKIQHIDAFEQKQQQQQKQPPRQRRSREDILRGQLAAADARYQKQQQQQQQQLQPQQTQQPEPTVSTPQTKPAVATKPTTPAPQQTTQPTPSVTPVKPEQKPTTEFSDLTFDQLIAVTDLILEYDDVLYNDSNDIFMESITEPHNVQEAVPGLWEDYLTQHTGYDSKTHTFIDPKTQKRVQAPFARGTSKEMNRRNAFLKRHNFNPENGTIEIDEIDPSTGQKMRVPVEFIMGSRKIGDIRNSKMSMNPTDGVPYDFVSAKMRLGGTDLMKRGDLTEPWFGHETAHAHQANAIRRQLRTQPHHRQLDDLLAARQRAKESGNYERMYEYDQKVHDYIQTHRTALEKESKHFTLGGWDAVDKLLADDSRYKRATENSKKHNADLSTHDVSPWELHADDYGGRLSSKYTRGKNKMVDALQANADPVRNDMIHSARKTLANKGVDASAVSDETIERTVVDKPKSHEVRKQIARENVAADAAKEMQDQKYRRKLAKETLQTQVASGKLTPQQEQKAKKKIAAIDAYDKKTSTIQESFYMNPNTFDVVQVGSEDTIKIDGVDWFEVDEAMIPLIQLCNKKGYTTSFSCSGHSPGMHEYSSDGKRLTSRRFNGFPYVAFAKIHDFKNLPTGWTYETFSDDGKSALYYNDAPNAFPTDKWDRIMAREENIIHAIRELCVYFDTKLPDLTNESVQESFIMEAHAPKKLYFHVSPTRYYDGQVFKPRVPEYIEPYDPNDKHFEDSTTPRVCFSTSIEGALNAITVNIQRTNPVTFDTMYVYIPEKPINEYKHKTNKELIKEKRVYDANVTDEIWIMEPVRMKLYGAIHVDQCKRVKKKSTVAAANGARATRNQFTYKWHWLVKPKVLDKATEFRYDTMTVCNNLADELNHFRYGLIKDGKLDTKASDKDYDKYWKLATPEEFEQAGGGICYDFVEWEAGYLDAYGIRCNKFFASCMGQNDEYATHTFIVVKDNGKYIYIEKAFKRISDEIHNIKVFDKLDDIFDYVVETMVEYEHVPEFNYGIIEYTDDTPKAGTPMHEYQYWISKNGKFIKTGNMKANKKKE